MNNEFYFQMGHGQLEMIPNLISLGIGDGIILSPKDVKFNRCEKFVKDVRKIKPDISIIFDPQFYFPKFDHDNVVSYPYYIDNFETDDFYSNSSKQKEFHNKLVETQLIFDADIILTPAIYRKTFSLANFRQSLDFANEFREVAESEGRPIYLTLQFHIRTLLDSDYFDKILSLVTNLGYKGIYLVLELEEEEKFLWTNQANMYLVMKFLHHLVNNNIDIIMGYSAQSIIPMLVTGITKYASGHHRNLRTFETERWSKEKEVRTPKDKYYSHKLLTDLDIDSDLELLFQRKNDLYELIRSPSPFDNSLFDGDSPATIPWRRYSYRHYIYCCDQMKTEVSSPDKSKRYTEAIEILENADNLFSSLKKRGVSFKRRVNDGSHIRGWIAALNAYEDEFM